MTNITMVSIASIPESQPAQAIQIATKDKSASKAFAQSTTCDPDQVVSGNDGCDNYSLCIDGDDDGPEDRLLYDAAMR